MRFHASSKYQVPIFCSKINADSDLPTVFKQQHRFQFVSIQCKFCRMESYVSEKSQIHPIEGDVEGSVKGIYELELERK